MPRTDTVSLTGDDLTADEVWAVAVEGAGAGLSDEARDKIRAARDLVDEVAAGSSGEHTYGINTGFGRFVEKTIPPELSEELQLRLLRSHACGVGEPYPDEVVRAAMVLRANALAKGSSGVALETVELLLECLNRGVLPQVPAPRLGRRVAATSRRSRTSRCRSSARARRRSRASCCPAARRSRGPGSSRCGCGPRRGSRWSTGRSSWPPSARSGSCAPGGSPRPPTSRARSRSRRSRAPASRSCPEIQALRPLPGQIDSAANVLRLVDGSAIIEAHRWCDKVQDAYSLRCVPQVHGASRDLIAYADGVVAVEVNAATDNPLVLVETRRARLERQLPRPAGRVRARHARDRGHRAREHLGAARRAARRTRASRAGSRRSSRRTAGSTPAS